MPLRPKRAHAAKSSNPQSLQGAWRSTVTALILALAVTTAQTQSETGWSGNFARNPGFEEDFVNANAEGHVLSFKGDWYYNQQDLVPDYWKLQGAWAWSEQAPHGGRKSLKLEANASVTQSFPGAVFQAGGTSWAGASGTAIPLTKPEKFPQPWRATAWCRGGGTLTLGTVSRKAEGGDAWQQITVEVPAHQVSKDGSMTLTLTGPGEFDDLMVQEKFAPTPNLIFNAGFENADKNGQPASWSQQKKFDWIGPTYYVWTDWNHFHSENRGPVTVDPLVFYDGKQSLRFDVYPGDEKFVESEPITLNQDQPHLIEVGAFVRADRIKMIDIRAVDEDGANLPAYYPIQPENKTSGTATFGNGTFDWRYIRKFFAMPFNEPIKIIRVRLAARGFNANTLDDVGTRSYASQSGTVWWDNVRVTERMSTAAELQARGVQLPASAPDAGTDISRAALDLGERLYGNNRLTLAFTNSGKTAPFRIRLTTTLPAAKPVVTESKPVTIKTGGTATLAVLYRIDKLAGDIKQQGSLRLQLLREKAVLTDTSYAFNTWPEIVDFDISRHYNLEQENPVTVSLNLGVSADTLAQVKTLEIETQRASDKVSLNKQTITDLKAAFARTIAGLPKERSQSYEHNLSTPEWWADRTNLLITKLDLSKLKVWPHDNPTRDTVLHVRALDARGRVLFSDTSDRFCRMAAPPKQEAIQTVQVREDGAILINGKPRLLTGATHQHMRLTHTPEIIAQLGLMGHRLVQGPLARFEEVEKMWTLHNLYALQAKPVSGAGGTVAHTDMTSEESAALEKWVGAGGAKSVVSFNTGGWESHIPDTPEARATHAKLNDWVRGVTGRPTAWSTSGAYNAWWIPEYPYYDIIHAETEMWGPMDFNTIFTPYMKRERKEPTAWVYLPQLYDNTPYERYRFETYENIIRGAAGVSMIQGIGDATLNRGLAGELRYLEAPLNSQEKAPPVTIEPGISHKVTSHNGKTYILATNAGPIIAGDWKWNSEIKQSGRASHEGDSVNRLWRRPGGVRLHGFRGLPMPELIMAGDKIVQYVWLDPKEKPDWVGVAVRGDGKFSHVGVLGDFDFNTFREKYGNVFMFSELEHSVWHHIRYVMDEPLYQSALKLMGKEWADKMKTTADAARKKVDETTYKPEHFHKLGALPAAGQWVCLEMTAEQLGLVGKLIDGFAYMTKNGRALWDYSAIERDGKVVRVFSEDTVGIDRALLKKVRINVPGLKAGVKIKALFEDRTITAEAGGFTDNFEGEDTYGHEAGAVTGDLFGFVKDDSRDLPRMMPSGYGYSYGPTAVHIYEIEP